METPNDFDDEGGEPSKFNHLNISINLPKFAKENSTCSDPT